MKMQPAAVTQSGVEYRHGNPAIPGVYPVRKTRDGVELVGDYFCAWDGKQWGYVSPTAEEATPVDADKRKGRPRLHPLRYGTSSLPEQALADAVLEQVDRLGGSASFAELVRALRGLQDRTLKPSATLADVRDTVQTFVSQGALSPTGSHNTDKRSARYARVTHLDDGAKAVVLVAQGEGLARPTTLEALLASPEQLHKVALTPALAAELLALNLHNRALRAGHVDAIAAEITSGQWRENGDTIRISSTNVLLDGQHRCAAVIQANKAVPSLLVTGLADEVFTTIDNGLTRTTGDALSIRGDANSTVLAAVARLHYLHQLAGSPFNQNPANQPTTQQILAQVDAHPGLHESAKWAVRNRLVRSKLLAPSLAGFCHHVFHACDQAAAQTFFAALEDGAGLQAGSPILLLRNRLIDAQANRDKIPAPYKAALIFKAFKLHRAGATAKQLRVIFEGERPESGLYVL